MNEFDTAIPPLSSFVGHTVNQRGFVRFVLLLVTLCQYFAQEIAQEDLVFRLFLRLPHQPLNGGEQPGFRSRVNTRRFVGCDQ